MSDNDLDLLVCFRRAVRLPDEETAERVYRRATSRRRWRVLLPARLPRRTRIVLTVGLAGLVLVPAAVAFGNKIADLFEGTPAPQSISNVFAEQNRLADLPIRQRFAAKFPHADVSKAHGVIEIQTADGPLDLWAAPNDQRGQCWLIDWANDHAGPNGKFAYGSCDTSKPPGSNMSVDGPYWALRHRSVFVDVGRVYVDSATVRLTLADGSTTTLPVVEGFFLGSRDNGAKIMQVIAYDSAGKQVAAWVPPS